MGAKDRPERPLALTCPLIPPPFRRAGDTHSMALSLFFAVYRNRHVSSVQFDQAQYIFAQREPLGSSLGLNLYHKLSGTPERGRFDPDLGGINGLGGDGNPYGGKVALSEMVGDGPKPERKKLQQRAALGIGLRLGPGLCLGAANGVVFELDHKCGSGR